MSEQHKGDEGNFWDGVDPNAPPGDASAQPTGANTHDAHADDSASHDAGLGDAFADGERGRDPFPSDSVDANFTEVADASAKTAKTPNKAAVMAGIAVVAMLSLGSAGFMLHKTFSKLTGGSKVVDDGGGVVDVSSFAERRGGDTGGAGTFVAPGTKGTASLVTSGAPAAPEPAAGPVQPASAPLAADTSLNPVAAPVATSMVAPAIQPASAAAPATPAVAAKPAAPAVAASPVVATPTATPTATAAPVGAAKPIAAAPAAPAVVAADKKAPEKQIAVAKRPQRQSAVTTKEAQSQPKADILAKATKAKKADKSKPKIPSAEPNSAAPAASATTAQDAGGSLGVLTGLRLVSIHPRVGEHRQAAIRDDKGRLFYVVAGDTLAGARVLEIDWGASVVRTNQGEIRMEAVR